ncbi:valine--tRNA ligase [Sesbania bispinosa]|nr:valine--tRNA ligase [Sesbania bispinosa]
MAYECFLMEDGGIVIFNYISSHTIRNQGGIVLYSLPHNKMDALPTFSVSFKFAFNQMVPNFVIGMLGTTLQAFAVNQPWYLTLRAKLASK